ncbi:MAG: uroporphyrinogen-III synthase [Acidobacteriota bacterium]
MGNSLGGRTILITRSQSQAAPLRHLLRQAGAHVLEVPTIEIQPRLDSRVDIAIHNLREYDWLLFTSANGVEVFLRRAQQLGGLPVSPGRPRLCAIGPATERRMEDFGLQVDLVPRLFQAEGVLEDLLNHHQGKVKGLKILLPRASRAREILPSELRRQGARVDVLEIYDTVPPGGSRQKLKRVLEGRPPDLVTFTSSSTVDNFVALAGETAQLEHLDCAAIGPVTASTATRHGLRIVLQPEKSTIPDLVDAIQRYFSSEGAVSMTSL